MSEAEPTSVLFICLGNICRSPLAEGVYLHQARAAGAAVHAESCGTGSWHVGERPDRRALAVARKHGVELPSLARQIDPGTDFERFGVLAPVDASTRDRVLRLGAPAERTHLVMGFHPDWQGREDEAPDVPDPYYGDDSGFDEVYGMLVGACGGLLEAVRRGAV